MKIALCISGHSRNYKFVYPNSNFEADIFISSCIQSGLPPEQIKYLAYHYHDYISTKEANTEDIITQYNPKIWEFLEDSYIPNELEKFKNTKTSNGYNLLHIGMMFFRLYKANKFKKVWEYQNNFKYDFVIRSRFDIKIDELNFDENKLHILIEDNICKDLLFYGPSYLIDQVCEIYEWFKYQTPESLYYFISAEHILKYYLDQLNILNDISTNFSFTFLKDHPIETKKFKNGQMERFNILGDIIQ
jgi:hypothetical protein